MRETRDTAARVELRVNEDGTSVLFGYAAVFPDGTEKSVYRYGSVTETITPGAFARALRDKQDVRALFNHDSGNLLGRISSGTLRLVEDQTGLRYEIDMPELGDTLWSNYKTYQRTYVDPEDLTLANTCAAGGSEKGAAVQQWVLALWAKYYEVKDLLAAAETLEALRAVDISTATLTPPPYTIRELNEEAAAFLEKAE